jgi:transcriptional regulator with XRE-family HTH domain
MVQNFGEEIRSLRKARGLSQRRVAELLGVTTVTVWNWEAGRVAPWPKKQAAILRTLGEAGSLPYVGEPHTVRVASKGPPVPTFPKRRRLIDNVGEQDQ